MSPYSIWLKKRIKLPVAIPGTLKLNMTGFNKIKKLTLKILSQTDIYYDKSSGIVAMGDIKKTVLDDNIQLGENLLVSLYDNQVKCVYVKLEPNLFGK